MKKMKLSLFLAAMMAVSSVSFAQSNDKGVIQIGLGYGALIGGGKLTATESGQSFSESLAGVRGNFGVRAQYGLAKNISAGIFLREEGAAYVTTANGYSSGTSFVTSGVGLGIEAKYYLVNKDKFNLYGAPSIGFSSGKAWSDVSNKISMSGLNYGVGIGLNWYWADFIGMSADIGYSGISISGKDTNSSPGTTITDKINSGGVMIGVGLITKFGGK
jgi:hypothetical protein